MYHSDEERVLRLIVALRRGLPDIVPVARSRNVRTCKRHAYEEFSTFYVPFCNAFQLSGFSID